jgi:hypothetical protein
MKAELKLNQIETTKLGTDICHIELTLIVKNLTRRRRVDENIDGMADFLIKCNLSSTRLSDFRLNSSHELNELHTLTRWFDTTDRKDVTNKEKVRKFIKEKLDAHKTLNSEKTIGLG